MLWISGFVDFFYKKEFLSKLEILIKDYNLINDLSGEAVKFIKNNHSFELVKNKLEKVLSHQK